MALAPVRDGVGRSLKQHISVAGARKIGDGEKTRCRGVKYA